MRFSTCSAWAKALTLATLACDVQAFRNVLYIDKWHGNITTAHDSTAGISHVIMAFVDPLNFTTNDTLTTPPLMPVDQLRGYFDNGTQFGIALGGAFASNLASWMKDQHYDFVDIDWEYPGGNGASNSTNPEKEIADFPLMLGAIKSALTNQSVGSQNISLSVAATPEGMAAFQNPNQTQAIWENIDFITIMAYDYINRGSKATGHHSDVESTKTAVQRYLDLGLCAEKINLGFAFFAKYFQVNGTCANSTLPIGCPIMPGQYSNGTDLLTSGVLTFEYKNINRDAITIGALSESADGTCGFFNNSLTSNKCKDPYCCSEDGWCGDTPKHCLLNCQTRYGQCHGPDTVASFERARLFGQYDEKNGGMWYLDETTNPKLFWTWETTQTMSRKFDEIVNNSTAILGGISGWSLGEDSSNLEHLKAMQNMTRLRAPSPACKAV